MTVAEDAQQSDAASGVDTQSGVGSEMNDDHGEECGGEATTDIIDEINKKGKAKASEEKTIDEEVKVTPTPSSTTITNKSPPAKEPQKFEEESKVHEAVSSDENSTDKDEKSATENTNTDEKKNQ